MRTLLIIAAGLLLVFSANAQKLGYIDFNDILTQLPAYKKAQTDLEDYKKPYDTKMQTMLNEYQTKLDDYQSKQSMMTESIRQATEKELINMENNIREFQQTSENDLVKKQNDLLQPIIDKLRKDVGDVAKENGYRNVIDSSVLVYKEPADDLTPLVKKKLGIAVNSDSKGDNKSSKTDGKK